MGDVSKSAKGMTHGNTLVVHKARILFQIYPGISGTTKHRCIPGVEYQGKVGNMVFFGVTDEYGGVEIFVATGETTKLEIFETVYLIALKTEINPNSIEGTKERLTILGYYTGAINGSIDEEIDLAVLNFEADISHNAIGLANGVVATRTQDKLKKQIGEQ